MNETEIEVEEVEEVEGIEEKDGTLYPPIAYDKGEEIEHRELEIKTIEWWDKFNKRFGKSYAYPAIQYTLRGGVAGTATYQRQLINYNMGLYRENKEKYSNRTIPHEIAHLFNYRIHVENRGAWGGGLKPHGREWKNIMMRMGLDYSRCHDYKVTKVRKVTKDYIYKCACKEHKVSSILHNKMMKGKTYKCNTCRVRITYFGKEEVSSKIPIDRVEIEKKRKRKELEEKQALLAMLG